MATSQTTLQTGAEVLNVTISTQSQVEVTGTFGSVSLTGISGLVEDRVITDNAEFASAMTTMRFTLTGAGPVEVKVSPLNNGNVSVFKTTPS